MKTPEELAAERNKTLNNFEVMATALKEGIPALRKNALKWFKARGLSDTDEIPAGVSDEEFVRQAKERLDARE